MSEGSDATGAVIRWRRRRVAADDGISERRRPAKVPDATTVIRRGVVRDRTANKIYSAKSVEYTPAIQPGVPTHGTVRDGRRQVEIVDATTTTDRAVAADCCTRHRQCAAVEDSSAS